MRIGPYLRDDLVLLICVLSVLQGDIEFLNEEKNEFVRFVISDVGQSLQEETDERKKALADSEKALEELRVLHQTQAVRERWYRVELQEIQQELIKVLGSETGSRMIGFGVTANLLVESNLYAIWVEPALRNIVGGSSISF